jgi:hypothetical protein
MLNNWLNSSRFHPFIGHKGRYGEQRYSSTLFLTSALEGGEGSASRPCRTLVPGKTRYPLYRRLGGPQGRSGQVWKISPPPGLDPRAVQPVGIRYTDYATRPTIKFFWSRKTFHCITHKNWETAQWLICHYDLFSQILRLKKAISKNFFFQCGIGHFTWRRI